MLQAAKAVQQAAKPAKAAGEDGAGGLEDDSKDEEVGERGIGVEDGRYQVHTCVCVCVHMHTLLAPGQQCSTARHAFMPCPWALSPVPYKVEACTPHPPTCVLW